MGERVDPSGPKGSTTRIRRQSLEVIQQKINEHIWDAGLSLGAYAEFLKLGAVKGPKVKESMDLIADQLTRLSEDPKAVLEMEKIIAEIGQFARRSTMQAQLKVDISEPRGNFARWTEAAKLAEVSNDAAATIGAVVWALKAKQRAAVTRPVEKMLFETSLLETAHHAFDQINSATKELAEIIEMPRNQMPFLDYHLPKTDWRDAVGEAVVELRRRNQELIELLQRLA